MPWAFPSLRLTPTRWLAGAAGAIVALLLIGGFAAALALSPAAPAPRTVRHQKPPAGFVKPPRPAAPVWPGHEAETEQGPWGGFGAGR
jgi:hypothetical protein